MKNLLMSFLKNVLAFLLSYLFVEIINAILYLLFVEILNVVTGYYLPLIGMDFTGIGLLFIVIVPTSFVGQIMLISKLKLRPLLHVPIMFLIYMITSIVIRVVLSLDRRLFVGVIGVKGGILLAIAMSMLLSLFGLLNWTILNLVVNRITQKT